MIDRGTVIIAVLGGSGGRKPRPAVVVEASDLDFPETVVVLPLSTGESNARILKPEIMPDLENGLLEPSHLMTHRITAVRKSQIGKIVGRISADDMMRADFALSLVLGLDRA